ncbi:hypothetical protein [Haloferula sp. BvORR071]|uniref:hypothetical protein n=1 Tax=Haloferula sp. BvORR071 TaxID=1396141 RepID=UPI00055492FA|nr:hypothetical protein [Haloferula sp. BvORR071]
MKTPKKFRENRGFALVISMALMVLITLLAIALLSLSSISLRSSERDQAMAEARANARLSLMLAIGQLQKAAGPDQRVTARAGILDEKIACPQLTGVWNSWEIKATSPPNASDYSEQEKAKKFRTWLVSDADAAAPRQTEFARKEPKAPVTLWGEGTLGKSAPKESRVLVARLPVGKREGNLAWAAMDEGLKARIDTPHRKKAETQADRTQQLGAGERPASEMIAGLDGLGREMFEAESSQYATLRKGITRQTFGVGGDELAPGVRAAMEPLFHDVTTQSQGLFTDTAHGGLKQDFQLLANGSSLPSAYAGKGVYNTCLGMSTAEAPSDPRWESLHQFGRAYRDRISNTAGVPLLKAFTPTGWQSSTGNPPSLVMNRKPPAGVVLTPTIAKVQMLFSLVARDIYSYPAFGPGDVATVVPDSAGNLHGPQDGHFRGTKYKYDLHLLYTPVVTLHNPYNVALEFRNLRIEFVHVPFAMQIFRNGLPQSSGLVPLETMYADNDTEGKGKIFGMNLKTKLNNKPGSTTFRMLPGEVKMFSPYIDPSRTYAQDLADRKFWDIYVDTGITSNIDAIPGWRGDGIGFDCDWLAGAKKIDGNKENGHWESCLGLARDDRIHVQFAPLSESNSSGNKFVIRMAGSTGTSSAVTTISTIEMNYESPTGLQDSILGKNQTLRFPKTGAVMGVDMLDHSTRQIKDIVNAKPFALLSAQAKVTSGARDASTKDGRLATKPWCFAHANIGASAEKIVTEHAANHSHEVDLQMLELGQGTSNLLQIDQQDRSNFITGHSSLYGSKFGVQYDIPLGPVQSLASLNGGNPGGSSGYLPRFAQPIGNSWAHPLLAPDRIVQGGSGGNYLDHSFLLNLALYDRFYFSGLGEQSGPFGGGKTALALGEELANGKGLGDPRLAYHAAGARPVSAFTDMLGTPEAYTKASAWQMMQGAFNINSTSVPAWKAMLASVHDPEALCNLINPAGNTSALGNLNAVKDGSSRISRLRLPDSPSVDGGAAPGTAYWLGPREYDDKQLEKLAKNIVEQVRLRGPFLSMAEFVNRQVGSDEKAQRGALQQAIDDSDLNRDTAVTANAGYEIGSGQVVDYKYANPAAGVGSSYQGAPGYLSQADLLNVLGNAATPRSDTFTIRGYGEALDANGKVLAAVTCEAVVQRFPEWIDSHEAVETQVAALQTDANKKFGRRFQIVSFRWLNPKEV